MKICYESKNFRAESRQTIRDVDQICREYDAQGYLLTLRQIYYVFVSRDLFPDDRKWRQVPGTNKWVRDPNGTKNADPNYKYLGQVVNDGRIAGLIDWSHLEDRTRNLEGNLHHRDPAHRIQTALRNYALDKWDDQPYHVEVWVEKEALAGVIERTARRLDVSYFSCRGYVSQSEMHAAAKRLEFYAQPVIIHLGDHDPSGIDMTRDIEDRLTLFGAGQTEVKRIALNMDQIERYNPPPNPAKLTDTRATDYIRRYGDESWELDALDPATLDALITDAVLSYRDEDLWDARVEEEEEDKKVLTALSQNWTPIEEHVKEEYL